MRFSSRTSSRGHAALAVEAREPLDAFEFGPRGSHARIRGQRQHLDFAERRSVLRVKLGLGLVIDPDERAWIRVDEFDDRRYFATA